MKAPLASGAFFFGASEVDDDATGATMKIRKEGIAMAKFYECKKCGNFIGMVKDVGVVPVCCGAEMSEAGPFSSGQEGAEKHVPLVHEENGKVYVQIGSTLHPMDSDHYIDWVYLLTDQGTQRKVLHPGMKPEVVFLIGEEEVVLSVEAHCTKHGLWSANV
jgi:superoxide reductase